MQEFLEYMSLIDDSDNTIYEIFKKFEKLGYKKTRRDFFMPTPGTPDQ